MFQGCLGFNQDLSPWDISHAASLQAMFASTSINILPAWDTSAIESFVGLFENTPFNQDISSWSFAAALNVTQMFAGSAFNHPSIGSINVSNITNFSHMFDSAFNFNQNLSSWNVAAGQDFEGMFANTPAFNSPLTGWNVSGAAGHFPGISIMFQNANVFNQDLSSWNTTGLTNYISTFDGCIALDQDFSTWDVKSLSNANNMFNNVTLSNANYNKLLNAWAIPAVGTSVLFSGGNSHYDSFSGGVDGVTAHTFLTGVKSWTISDAGPM
jgi:hypothetical protein